MGTFKKIIFASSLLFWATFLVATPLVSALSPEQQLLYRQGINYFDVNACSASGASTQTSTIGGAVYMLGDSITARAKDNLDTEFTAKSATPYINASTSRSITKAGTDDGFKTSGLDALDGDQDRVKNASTIVIALGTNQRDSDFKQSIKDTITKVKGYNAAARIYWVNVFSEGKGSNKIDKDAINKIINDSSDSLGYTVIDTTDKNIELDDSDKIHETIGTGTKNFADTVVGGVAGGNTADPGTQCSCDAGSIGLTGSDNESKVYNYLTGTAGLKPFQAAGIMGSMFFESNYEPQRLQSTPSGKETPAESLSPGQLSDTNLGWGIVQWTPPGKIINTFSPKSKANDLGAQLKFLQDQLDGKTTSPEKAAGDQLKATTDVVSAASTFELKYERHAGLAQPERANKAQDILTKLGSAGGGDPAADTADTATCSVSSDGSGEVTGEYSLPVAKKWFTEHEDYFTKPHHDYPAADIPVTSGTKIFSVAKGEVSELANSGWGGGAGTHVFVKDGDVVYGYFHGTPGSVRVKVGDTVEPGQLLMLSDNTGHSEGAHLHFQIEVGGVKHCPQNLLEAIGKGTTPPAPKTLPTSGCTN
ncbi:MAG: Peptidase [Candidatus Saccharibacteria bacterium]|nr:Peptidase [Candidatus Saccharibacteria bacterium]